MVEFMELFLETKGDPIEYQGKTLLMVDDIKVEENFQAELELISVNSSLRQGICMDTKGELDSGCGETGERFVFWQELWTEIEQKPLKIKGKSKNGIVTLYNCWQDESGSTDYWRDNGAMIKETIGKNEYMYHCNDGEFDDDFDDLVFRLKILEGSRED